MDVTISDSVALKNTSFRGKVKFVGQVQTKNGIFYGIELYSSDGKNNGTFNGQKYFECHEECGIFVKKNKISSICAAYNDILDDKRIYIDDKVYVELLECHGIVRYIGTPHFTGSICYIYYGIQLTEPKGNNNGIVDEKFYFSVVPKNVDDTNYGIFVKRDEFTKITRAQKRVDVSLEYLICGYFRMSNGYNYCNDSKIHSIIPVMYMIRNYCFNCKANDFIKILVNKKPLHKIAKDTYIRSKNKINSLEMFSPISVYYFDVNRCIQCKSSEKLTFYSGYNVLQRTFGDNKSYWFKKINEYKCYHCNHFISHVIGELVLCNYSYSSKVMTPLKDTTEYDSSAICKSEYKTSVNGYYLQCNECNDKMTAIAVWCKGQLAKYWCDQCELLTIKR